MQNFASRNAGAGARRGSIISTMPVYISRLRSLGKSTTSRFGGAPCLSRNDTLSTISFAMHGNAENRSIRWSEDSKAHLVMSNCVSWLRGSAVPARLGLKAPALAWPEGASAFQNPRPSHGSRLWLGHGLAWPRPGLLQEIPYLVFAHYCYLTRAAHTSIDVGVRAREVLRRGVILFRLCLWASAKG